MPELWIPGAAGPSVEDFVARLHRAIEQFAAVRRLDTVSVEVQLHDGARLVVLAIRPEPGYGFVTLCPHPEEGQPPVKKGASDDTCTREELIVPVGSIIRITLSEPEPQTSFGFSLPQSA